MHKKDEEHLVQDIAASDDMDTISPDSPDQISRRCFLKRLGRWSQAAVAVAVFGSVLALPEKKAEAGWINRRGPMMPGGGWANVGGHWVNLGGPGWVNGGGWVNRGGGGWVNRRGGWGGGSWVNNRGYGRGGSWVNRRR
ncbi:hypothetical protein [Desulfovibrio inopinatus]|uniref:hypothetical protein n=1 Tax=Desulfovibrio inopinatus TaxID=102109 RepID=UPI000400B1D0|nr:hypothetical protein [Desulfovibrio inopinatus]